MNLPRTLRLSAAATCAVALFGQAAATFKSEVRLVEVHATVFEHSGKYLDGLTQERFQILDDGQPQTITAFEAGASDLSCAILLDTTGSMARALAVVKNATLKLVDHLRPNDAIAVYGFSTKLTALQDFTTDKNAVKTAVLRTRASGRTALFDAVSQVAKEIVPRAGKKVLVVFTDGQDNASVLNATAAVTRAKKVGVPIYTVAQGEALDSPALLRQLKELAQTTGGLAYAIRQSRQVDEVFQDIAADLQHTYLLAYKAPPSASAKWHEIKLTVSGLKGYRIRAKQGYFAE